MMNELEMFQSFDSKQQNTNLVANQHFAIKEPDLSEDQLCDKLRRPAENIHPTFDSQSFPSFAPQDPSSLLSSSHEYFDHSYAVLNDVDISNERMSFAPLPDPTVLNHFSPSYENAGLDLDFEPKFPFSSRIPVPTASSAVPININNNNNMPQAQTILAPISVPNGMFMWSQMNMRNPPQTSGDDFQQRFPMVASLPNQLSPLQTNLVQTQYMQAIKQFHFAEDELCMSTQPPYQPPVNVQSPQNAPSSPDLPSTQSLQQLQVSPHLPSLSTTRRLLPEMEFNLVEPEQSVCGDSIRRTAISTPLSTSTESSSIVTSVAVSSLTKQQVMSKYPSQSQKTWKNRTPRTVHTVQSIQNKLWPFARPTPWGQLAFTNLHDAESAMPKRYIEQDWRGPSSDETVPYTDADRAYWVAKMLSAMVDTSKCKDNKSGFSFLKRWEKHEYYNMQEMEKVCWHMLDVAERLHAHGPSATNIYCQDALKKLYASRGLTFEQRIVAICDMLALSKFLCDNLMKGEGIEALVGAPKQKMSGAKTMMVQNKKRQNWLETGRRTDAGRAYNENDDEHEFTVDLANIQEPSQRRAKRKRSAPPNEHRVAVKEYSHRVSLESDNSEESFGFSFYQPVFEKSPEERSDDDVMHESDRIISSTSSPASQILSVKRDQAFEDISSASPTSAISPTSALAMTTSLPSTYTIPPISAPPSPSPSPPKHYPPTRRFGGAISDASKNFQSANRRFTIHHETAKQRAEKRGAVSYFETIAQVGTKDLSGKLTIDLTASNSDSKDSDLTHKRSRKSSFIVGAHEMSSVPSYHSDSDGQNDERASASDGEFETIIPKHRCLVMDQTRTVPANPSYSKDPETSKSYRRNEAPESAHQKRTGTSRPSLRRKRTTTRRMRVVN